MALQLPSSDLPRGLLELSRALSTRADSEASLRRAISTAYYALFHLLIGDAARQMMGRGPSGLPFRIGRAFSHSEMLKVCKLFQSGRVGPGSDVALTLLEVNDSGGFEPQLATVAGNFVRLYGARQLADYDLSQSASPGWSGEVVEVANEAFDNWSEVKSTANAAVFMAALALQRRWGRAA